ncbi:putative disease resistance protein RGA1 [Prunus yedoensis var. nudiflora]|uniref:Putative disease resistance protein RGA1 n=1 Tax=Prunus yedoensis var. nudiflora TaxID=2094558 RepID=A0A314XK36_PRUYE|nr:putative disease resistance protein RGA1 [Prunus yedoensis var. nudiflora]
MPSGIERLHQLQSLPLFVGKKLPELQAMANLLHKDAHIECSGYNHHLHMLRYLNLYGELNITHLEDIKYFRPARLSMKENLESLGLYWGLIPQLRDSFPKLPNAQPEVGVSGSHLAPEPEEFTEGLQPHKNLKKLVINGYPGIKFPDWALPNLVAADFTNCRSCEHLPALGNLPLLKTLSLQGIHGMKGIGTEWSSANVGNAFPRLKKLTVKSCPKLAHIPLPQSLQHLELRNCNPTNDLVYLPEGLVASASLSSLKILSCPKLHSMPLEMQNLSSLKSLTIRWCEELSSLPQSLQNLKALESLDISNCNSLISLPDCGIGGLGSLQTLSIENCSNLTSLSSSLEQLTLLEHLTIMYCPNLSSFPAGVQHLSSLRSLIILSCPWFDSLPEGLQNVNTLHCLEIRSCPNLTYLPEWFKDLDCLRSLTIYDCPNLTLLPLGFNLLAKLQHLSIQECPELEERCRQGSGEDWSKIAHVPHKYIGSHQVKRSGKVSSSGSSSVQASSQ